ncbi:MAG TPA: [protein-PII] uridylyltransferase [Acidimicrobiales bacterium]|nr:[protein-PII] uridylyltransferase [Acidimicrobiales bacterium]
MTPTGDPGDGGEGALSGREAVVADRSLRGRALCRALATETDRWVVGLFESACGGDPDGLALVAVGGYGRGELAPGSDLDLWLLDTGRSDVAEVAERLWYPIWDAGVKLGHAVRSPRHALALAGEDLETATASLSVRHLAGEVATSTGLAERALAQWRTHGSRWLARLADRVDERHLAAGEVAFLLEPDIKDGRGGLRDVHALVWAEAARRVLLEGDAGAVGAAEALLLDVRVELHRLTGRPSDVLLLERQDDVARALDLGDADALMSQVAAAARVVAWRSDETWARLRSAVTGPSGRAVRRERHAGPGVVVREGSAHITHEADVAGDASLALRVGAAAAAHGARIDRTTLDRLAGQAPVLTERWPDAARLALVELLGTGRAAIGVLEALDQRRILERVLPEWEPTRSKSQRNALHRFTVDRHLCEAAANAARLVSTVRRPDLLLVGAWLHDLGKGWPGDHTVVGMELMGTIADRMGFPPADVDVLVALVRHHLLLPDVATRRDLSDDDVIVAVADAVGSLEVLELLAALTEADALATGPSAWGPWKAELVGELVDRTAHVLRGGVAAERIGEGFPPPEVAELMKAGATVVQGVDLVLTVVAPDRPGTLSRVAGALSLGGVGVLAADAASDDAGMAASRFRVSPPPQGIDWDALTRDVELALQGRIALEARMAERLRTARRPARGASLLGAPTVRIDNTASGTSTVVEVRAPDAIGRLYRITRALADLDLDIRTARISTLGDEAVDTFYVRTATGSKVVDRDHLRELERAVLHQVSL